MSKYKKGRKYIKSVLEFRSKIQWAISEGLNDGIEPNSLALFATQVITQMVFVTNKPKRARDVMFQALEVNLRGVQNMPIKETKKWVLKGVE
jgi:hypothetical protein